MIRFLILAGLFYIGYRALRSALTPGPYSAGTLGRKSSGQINDVMMKDPFCGVYFPRSQGVRLLHEGKELWFCTHKCRDDFLEEQDEKNGREEEDRGSGPENGQENKS